ncbi:MAG: hypothetical protein JRI59_09365 [Deltaproteobacteria bacterium]|nr:hypothetical protein [Deltaproteobacteria bacterium]
MKEIGQLGPAGAAPPGPERRLESFSRWYAFLEEESRQADGLLCFYDRHKSHKIVYFCGLLADLITGASGESPGAEPDTLAFRTLRHRIDDFLTPAKSVNKG